MGRAHQNNRCIRRAGQVGDARVAALAINVVIARVDRPDIAGEAVRFELCIVQVRVYKTLELLCLILSYLILNCLILAVGTL